MIAAKFTRDRSLEFPGAVFIFFGTKKPYSDRGVNRGVNLEITRCSTIVFKRFEGTGSGGRVLR